MDSVLLQFIRHLRHQGLAVSTSESLDAMQVVAALGYSDRQRLHDGLQSCLAKSRRDQAGFERCFAQFFALGAPAGESDGKSEHDQQAAGEREGSEASAGGADQAGANPALPGQGSGGGDQGSTLQSDMMRAAADIGLENIQYPTQRGLYRRRLLDALPDAIDNLEILRLQQGDSQQQDRALWLKGQRASQVEMANALIDRQLQLNNHAASRAFQEEIMRQMSLANMDSYYRKRLPELIRKLARKLASRHRQRYRRSRRGRLDLGKTLKQNIAYDGVPFRRHWKSTRKQRSELLVLCDISGSVSAWSQLLLLFLHALGDVIPKTRSFVFCDKSIEVTDLFQRHPAEQAMAETFRRYGLGSSDYGGALNSFHQQTIDKINRHSTVIILGDGRCNGADPGIAPLRKIYQRARLVLWFNPEARSRWNTGDSEIRRLQTACHFVAECGNLRQLERLLDQLLTQLH